MANQRKELQPVYLIVGEDKLRRKTVLSRLEKRMEDYGDMSFNSSVIDANNPEREDIVSSCNTMPFAAEKRLVIVENVSKLPKEDTENLITYIENPSNTCILALVSDKLAKNTRLYKTIARLDPACIISCENPKVYELKDKLVAIARSHGGSIAPDAANLLIQLVGTDTTHLDSEIQKLLLSTSDNNITVQHVMANTTKTAESKPWDFTNFYSEKNIPQAINVFRSMNDNAPFVLLPMTCKRIRELICVQDMGASANQNSIASKLKLAPWQCKNHTMWSRNFSKQQLLNALDEAMNCEADIKSGSNPKVRFEMFIVETLS